MATFVRILRDGDDFRVRTQAAFGLGRSRNGQYRPALEAALRDRHEAVRAAAANALGLIGSPLSLPALETARRDGSTAVRREADLAIAAIRTSAPSAPQAVAAREAAPQGTRDWSGVRVVVVIGQTSGQTPIAGLVEQMRTELVTNLGRVGTFAVFPSDRAIDGTARAAISSRRIPMVRVDGQLARVQADEHATEVAVRCDVTLTLVEQPGGNLRGMLRGTATGREDRDRDLVGQRRRLAAAAVRRRLRALRRRAKAPSRVRPR